MVAKKKLEDRLKPGRKTKYKPEYKEEAYKLSLLRAIDEDIADFFGVSVSTLTTWKKKYPTFLASIKKGKIKADAEIAHSLFNRAKGYSHPDVHISNYKGEITTTNITKHYPPDTAAAFIWLKNRAGWKDKQEHEHSLNKETATLLGLIDGTSKGRLPDRAEGEDAG